LQAVDAETRVREVLGDDLDREQVLCAVYASTQRWYQFPNGKRPTWWLALTERRVIIISAEAGDGSAWRGKRNVEAKRSDVDVEHFARTGLTTWRLTLNVRTEGHWRLHSVTALGIPLGSRVSKARQIAESLGWQG
jgi:hypothetical protein